ncbi:MAG: hypothetical protein LAT84_07830 [Balneolia bacterium]|nr:hypothetical protein [Balneolia bacterium]
MRKVFSYQYEKLMPFRVFCNELGISPNKVEKGDAVPLLPVEAFRDAEISSISPEKDMLRFRSSGTTGMKRSAHYVPDPELYRKSLHKGLHTFYPVHEFVILAYTPGYNENPESSLIWMLNELISTDETGLSRFLVPGEPISPMALDAIKASNKRILLFGAAFGLIDLAEKFPVSLPSDSIIMETGGMKTHRREMSRDELHKTLASAFTLDPSQVHSEYGMTEMLSQAYADGTGWFRCPGWLKISVRNPQNPLEEVPAGKEGLIGIIDLANVHSCSFILTGDKGVQKEDGRFQVMGRFVPENLRGCNFLIDRD